MNIPSQALDTTKGQAEKTVKTHSDRRSIFDKLRNIWVKQTACNNVDELVRSKDFRRSFSKVLSLHPEYNKENILKTLLKIRDQVYISPEDQEELLTCISDPEFILNSKYTQNRLKGFAAREAAIFLELYPVSEILKHLKLYVSDEIKELFEAKQDLQDKEELPDHETNLSGVEYSVKIERKMLGVDYVLATRIVNGKTKWACKRKRDLFFNDDFIYDNISGFSEFGEINDEIFVSVSIGEKSAYISLNQIILDTKIHEEQLFDSAGRIKKTGEKIVYEVRKNGKVGYVVAGEEKETSGNIIFDHVSFRPTIDGHNFYFASIGDKEAYFEQGSIVEDEDIQRMGKDISSLETDSDGNFFYTYKKQGRWFGKKTATHVFNKQKIVEIQEESQEEINTDTDVEAKTVTIGKTEDIDKIEKDVQEKIQVKETTKKVDIVKVGIEAELKRQERIKAKQERRARLEESKKREEERQTREEQEREKSGAKVDILVEEIMEKIK